MSRWHSRSCKTPDVVDLDGFLTCKCCLECAPAEGEEAPGALTTSAPPCPPNPPQGQLRLSWPTSLNYTAHAAEPDDGATATDHDSAPAESPSENIVVLPGSASGPCTKQALTHGALEEPDHIRLLRISPGPRAAPLHGNLRIAGLQSKPDYEALSYTWADDNGDSSRSRRLYIGAYWDIVPITANCESALRCVRDPNSPRTVWVDSVCIDQESDRERSHQVGMMGRIYSYASRVTSYLGPQTESSGQALAALRREELRQQLGDKDAFRFSPSELKCFQDLFGRRYFSRLWIVQEMCLARTLGFRCDHDSPYRLDHKQILPKLRYRSVLPNWLEQSMAPSLDAHGLLRLVVALGGSHCADARDHIFSLLGLYNPVAALHDGLLPSYTLSEAEIFTGFAAYSALKVGDAHVILELAVRSRPTTIPLPSWVPNWAQDFSQDVRIQFPGPHYFTAGRRSSIALHQSIPEEPTNPITKSNRELSIEDQYPASHRTLLNGGLVLSGDWLVRDADDFTPELETSESPAPGQVTLRRAGRAPGCAITLRVRISGRAEPGLDPTRSRLNIFRAHGRSSVLVLRTRAGSTQQEFLGLGIVRLEANEDVEPWRGFKDWESTQKCLRLGSKADELVGNALDHLETKSSLCLTSIWSAVAPSPVDSQNSGLSILRDFWSLASNRVWMEDSNRFGDLGDWAGKEMKDDVQLARAYWTRFQDLETTLGGMPPTDGLLSSSIATDEPVSKWVGAGVATQAPVPTAVRDVNLWFCLLVQLIERCSPINSFRDLYFKDPKWIMRSQAWEIRRTLLHTVPTSNSEFTNKVLPRLQTMSDDEHLLTAREILRIHRAKKPDLGEEGASEYQPGSEPLLAGYWDWAVLKSHIDGTIAYWEECGAFWDRFRAVALDAVQADFIDDESRREMQNSLGLSLAWNQSIVIT
jgi:hypothetical protein